MDYEKLIAILSLVGFVKLSSKGAFVALWFHVFLIRTEMWVCVTKVLGFISLQMNKEVKRVDSHCVELYNRCLFIRFDFMRA